MVSRNFLIPFSQPLPQPVGLLEQFRMAFRLARLVQRAVHDPGDPAFQEAAHRLEGVDGVDGAGAIQVGIAIGQDDAEGFSGELLPFVGLEGVPAVDAELSTGR